MEKQRYATQFKPDLRSGQLSGVVFICFALLSLQACIGNGTLAPVSERTQPLSAAPTGHHVVQKGDTLYSIAWRYGIDYKELSRRNKVKSGYVIYPGQLIYLDVDGKNANEAPKFANKTTSSRTQSAVARTPRSMSGKSGGEHTQYSNFQWQWPTQGKIIRNFSPKSGTNKGIDIEGRLGEPVVSAAPGSVVYAGDGLRGYGKLLIIKHNDTFLSAYAHNSKLLVKEGEKVKGNQQIAEIGSSGTDTAKLHFEIRREGKPVNPLLYLPKR